MIGKTIIIGALVSFAGAVLVSRVAKEDRHAAAPALAVRAAGVAVAVR